MATLSPTVAQSVDRYIRSLRQRRRIVAVYVYGSQANGSERSIPVEAVGRVASFGHHHLITLGMRIKQLSHLACP